MHIHCHYVWLKLTIHTFSLALATTEVCLLGLNRWNPKRERILVGVSRCFAYWQEFSKVRLLQFSQTFENDSQTYDSATPRQTSLASAPRRWRITWSAFTTLRRYVSPPGYPQRPLISCQNSIATRFRLLARRRSRRSLSVRQNIKRTRDARPRTFLQTVSSSVSGLYLAEKPHIRSRFIAMHPAFA